MRQLFVRFESTLMYHLWRIFSTKAKHNTRSIHHPTLISSRSSSSSSSSRSPSGTPNTNNKKTAYVSSCSCDSSDSDTSAIAAASPSCSSSVLFDQIEETIARVLARFPQEKKEEEEEANTTTSTVNHRKWKWKSHAMRLWPTDREVVVIALSLQERIQDLRRRCICPRCWLPQPRCICSRIPRAEQPPLSLAHHQQHTTGGSSSSSSIQRLFVLMHHREIGGGKDTAKLIAAAYPEQVRLVIAGIDSEYQDSMQELEDAIALRQPTFHHHQNHHHQQQKQEQSPCACVLLYPSELSATVADTSALNSMLRAGQPINVVVLDGTWNQTRRMYCRYIEPHTTVTHIKLSNDALEAITTSRERGEAPRPLRNHPIAWKEIGTCAATGYFLQDLERCASGVVNRNREGGQVLEYDKDHILVRYQAYLNEAYHTF